jgi:hypothetical protein
LANPALVAATWGASDFGDYYGTFTLSASGGQVASFSISLPSNPQIYGLPSVVPLSGGPVDVGTPITISVYLKTGSPSPLPFTMAVAGPANTGRFLKGA